jgi:hypothetical protein
MVYLQSILLVVLGLFLSGCKPTSPEKTAGVSAGVPQHGFMLSQSDFDGLSVENQYVVINKALSTMYRGLPMDEFFDLSKGLVSPVAAQKNILIALQEQLTTPLSQAELGAAYKEVFGFDGTPGVDEDDSIPARFTFDRYDAYRNPHQQYMARVQGYPLSKDMMSYWMSYFLANTIMFSPAREMDSADYQDIARVLGYLQETIEKDTSIRDTVRGWLHNLSRWRVSRSAENHALEMFELYLGLFNDTEEEQRNTINGGIACSEWYLTDNGADYQLAKDVNVPDGSGSVKVFDNYISDCDGLYDLVAGHPLLIPRVTEVIVNYFLDGSNASAKEGLIQNIINQGPVTFEDVFMQVIFSKEFLLNSQRPKTFEENAFNFLGAMHWNPRANSGDLGRSAMERMLNSTSHSTYVSVDNMGWPAMNSKIGRTPFLPMDVLSFATYHRGIRESVLMNQRAYDGYSFPEKEDYTEAELSREPPYEITNGAFYVAGTENLKPELEDLNASEFIDFIFLTALGRRAVDAEHQTFEEEGVRRSYLRVDEDEIMQLIKTDGDLYWEDRTDDFAEVMLDYISRLPEFYYFKAISQ